MQGALPPQIAGVDIWLHDRCVSRTHAELRVHGGAITLTDLGSRHGTYLNTKRLAAHAPTQLRPRDRLRRGKLQFIVERRAGLPLEVEAARTFGRELERGLAHAARHEQTAVAVQVIALVDEIDATFLRDALAAEFQKEAFVLASDRELLVLVQAVSITRTLYVADQLERIAREAGEITPGIALYPQDGVDPESLVAAARSAAKNGRTARSILLRDMEITIGQTRVLIADQARRIRHRNRGRIGGERSYVRAWRPAQALGLARTTFITKLKKLAG